MALFSPQLLRGWRWIPLSLFLLALAWAPRRCEGGMMEDARKLFVKGDYEACIELCEKAIKENEPGEDFRIMQVRSQFELGRVDDALKSLSLALARYSRSLRLRVEAIQIFKTMGNRARVEETLQEIDNLGTSRAWAYRDPPNLVALGQAAVLMGADPKLVLDNFLEPAKRSDPGLRDTYLAIGELALSKHDSELAAKAFQEGLSKLKGDPDLLYGLARAHSDGDRSVMMGALESALALNPRHAPSLLLVVDHCVDAEIYGEAEEKIEEVLKINPKNGMAWAYRSVIRHLQGNAAGEAEARAKAFEAFPSNAPIAHVIGTKLSRKYRFLEGAVLQRQALTWDPDFLPAKIQLSQDMLRLGREEEGWELAEEVHKKDGYDVTAYNLVALKDSIVNFTSLTNAHFTLRMETKEAAVYGERVMALLERARERLVNRYGAKLAEPTLVEIFHKPGDFAVRTFGEPGNPGYLGVCFGRVITANSPASQGANPVNWEAVLWHEFCHVVTLQMTRNYMPRWLSEGISVYEERQMDPVWGQHMTPEFREMILRGDLAPIARLTTAFMIPKTPMHLQLAYFQASLVVEYLVEKHGIDCIKQILGDLRDGTDINASIARRATAFQTLQPAFDAWVKARAEGLAPGLDFDRPAKGSITAEIKKQAPGSRPNYWILRQEVEQAIGQRDWAKAESTIKRILEAYPDPKSSGWPYASLAGIYKATGKKDLEKAALQRHVQLESAAIESHLRLAELAAETNDWTAVKGHAERMLAIQPMLPAPHRQFAEAAERLGNPPQAIAAYKSLLVLDPPDPALVHFRLANLLKSADRTGARRHLLLALESAPRYRDAQRLLLEMQPASGQN